MEFNLAHNLPNNTVAVTGASGYIGSPLVEALVQKNFKVLRVSRRPLRPLAGTETLVGDLKDPELWSELVQRANLIYHLSGNTSIYEAEKSSAENLLSAVLPITHLVDASIRQRRKPRVVFASTSTVYGATPACPISETYRVEPATTYDLHKLFVERALLLGDQSGALNSVSLRLANVYGSSSSVQSSVDRGVLNRMVTRAIQGKDVVVYGTGNYTRDYVHITDVIKAFLIVGLRDDIRGEIFNIGTGRGITILAAFEKLVKLVASAAKTRSQIIFAPWPSGAHPIEMRNFVANINHAYKMLNWHPSVTFELGLESLVRESVNHAADST
jgi:UDP-glucose 4-epimerase